MAKITAIMVTRNEAEYISLSIQSIIDYVDEVLVFDNMSSDDTVDKVKELLPNPKIRLVQPESLLLLDEAFMQAQTAVQTPWMIRWDGDYIANDNIKNLFDNITKIQTTHDGLYTYVVNLYGDLYHTDKNQFRIYNVFACKNTAIQFGTNSKYAITYQNTPGAIFSYQNDPTKYPFYIYHLGGVRSDRDLVCRMFKNEYNLYLKNLPENERKFFTIESYLSSVVKKNISDSIVWFKRNIDKHINKHTYTLPKILDIFVKNPRYLIKYYANVPKRKSYINYASVKNYRITIIIRVYHNEEYLLECLNSIWKQAYQNYQVMIINDQLEKLKLEDYVTDPSRMHLVKLIDFGEYFGPIKSYQTALLHAETEVVAILENMDILVPNCLTDIMNLYNTIKPRDIFVWSKRTDNNWFITFKPAHYFMTQGLRPELLFGGHLIDVMSQLEQFAKPVYLDAKVSNPHIVTLPPLGLYWKSLEVTCNYHANLTGGYSDYIRCLPDLLPTEVFNDEELEAIHKITPNEYFDHVYVINLKKDTVKRDRMIKILGDLKIKAEIFPAVYGMDLYADFEAKCNKQYYVPGAYGYTLSMHAIFSDAKAKKYKRILVFDDDVIFHKDFLNKFDEFVRVIPWDWYILSLGVSGPWTHPFVNPDYQKFNYSKLYTNSFANTSGSHAMGYSSEVFDEIIQITSIFNHPFDDEVLWYYTDKHLNRCYAAMPHLVLSDASRSDIGKKCFKIADNYRDYHFRYRINLGMYDMDSLHHRRYDLLKLKYQPLVSIIMTVYDKEDYLYDTIQSVLNQTYKNIELVLVEDQSPDNCKAILKQFESHPNVKIIYNDSNVGCYVSRNRALKICRGEFIGFQDADDYCVSTRIEKQIDFMRRKGLKVSATDMLRSHIPNFKDMTEDQVLTKANELRVHTMVTVTGTIYAPCCRHYFNYPTMIFDREIFDKLGGFVESRKGMDMEYAERVVFHYEQKIFGQGEDSWQFFEDNDTFYYRKLPELLVISSEMTDKNITSHTEYNTAFEQKKIEWRNGYKQELEKRLKKN